MYKAVGAFVVLGALAAFSWVMTGTGGSAYTIPPIERTCMFAQSDLITPVITPEADDLFQRGRAHDGNIQMDQPDSIPVELRGLPRDRFIARDYYQRAAEMGHVDAMNNIAVYEQNGWGLDNDVYPVNNEASFYWNVEMARRGDSRGFITMAYHYLRGKGVAQDPDRAESCLVEAARRDDLRGIILLAEHDLGLFNEEIPDPPNENTIARGIALFEEVARRGDSAGFHGLHQFYNYKAPDVLKEEYYRREEFKMDPTMSPMLLEPIYRREGSPLFNPDQSACLQNYDDADNSELETHCPRPDGPLSRADAGLPEAPTEPYDLSTLQPSWMFD